MRDRRPLCTSWPERLTKMPFALTSSMKLGDFIDVLEQNGQTSLARRADAPEWNTTNGHATESDRDTNGSVSSLGRFPLELRPPGPVALPPILQGGRGRPAALTNARARKIIATACTGASIPVCAAAGGDAEALAYATLAALKAITEGIAFNPKHAFEFLARRAPDHWSKVIS
jgi:hypothetical protein